MADKRTMVINWDGLDNNDDDDDSFFESRDRISSALTVDIASSDSDDDFEHNRISFISAISAPPPDDFQTFPAMAASSSVSTLISTSYDYDVWMAEPGSIKERRQRLLQGMGLAGDKGFLRLTSCQFLREQKELPQAVEAPIDSEKQRPLQPSPPNVIVRSRSDGALISSLGDTKLRKEQFLLGVTSIVPRLIRSSSALASLDSSNSRLRANSINLARKQAGIESANDASGQIAAVLPDNYGGAVFFIKNLDTGKEFIINEDGIWNTFSDLQTGKQLTMEEFEKCIGYSPIVSELMQRENVSRILYDGIGGNERKVSTTSPLSKRFSSSKRRGAAWLKNIKGVANSMTGFSSPTEQRSSKKVSSDWLKVHQHGKSYKEFTGLYRCLEIQAHQGSIWTIRFSFDTRYLASAGEDRVIHVWEVVECDVSLWGSSEDVNSNPFHRMTTTSPGQKSPTMPSQKKRKGKLSSSSRKGDSLIPYYVALPDTMFSLSEKPVCSFQGHLDDVLDLSWSKSQQLLSSSMDKTVRLWDMESKTCLKLFAHNDYVTCIQFNPVDDRYFISGSLDAKVRIWSIPDWQVVDWTDLHEMVTAACYTPDGQGALVGSHKGSCRMYNTSECRLHQKGQIYIQSKKKSHAKKITGFQFAPGNPSEVLITSADSRIWIFDGADIIHKFRGFRNTSSQISASFTADGKYVVCASEDSQVYVWKRDEICSESVVKGKGLITTRSHEHFQCRDVSVAIPWPGSIKYEPPTLPLPLKRHSKRHNLQLPTAMFEDSINGSSSSSSSSNGKRHFSSIPRKSSFLERASSCPEVHSDLGDGGSVSFASAAASLKHGESPSISASRHSSSSSWMWVDGTTSNRSNSIQATAWGQVVVTAGLGGKIRAYQNFGLPLRLSR